MDAPQGVWRKDEARHSQGELYWLGRICVGSTGYALQSRGAPTRYRAEVRLPGIKINEAAALQPTIEESKAVVERVVRTWFARVSEGAPQEKAA
jgi:hypothetical protein